MGGETGSRGGGAGWLAGCGIFAGANLGCFLPVILAAFLFVGYMSVNGLTPGGDAALAARGCDGITAPTIVDPEALGSSIDEYIKRLQPNSPFVGLGSDFVAAGRQSSINPLLMVVIARKESTFGIAPIQGSPNPYNAFGRTATASQPNVTVNGRLWYAWPSWKESLYGQAQYIREKYVDELKKVTVADMMMTYAPPSENDTELYISQIKDWTQELVTAAGSSLDCSTGGTGPGAPGGAGTTLNDVLGWINDGSVRVGYTATTETLKPLKQSTLNLIGAIHARGYKFQINSAFRDARNSSCQRATPSSHCVGLAIDLERTSVSGPGGVGHLQKWLYEQRQALKIDELFGPDPDRCGSGCLNGGAPSRDFDNGQSLHISVFP